MLPNPWAKKALSVIWAMVPGSILRLYWVCSDRGQLAGFVQVEVSAVFALPTAYWKTLHHTTSQAPLLLAMANASLAFADELAAEEKGGVGPKRRSLNLCAPSGNLTEHRLGVRMRKKRWERLPPTSR